MSAPPYLPLFGSDYLADTRHLTTEEHGAYLLLMIAAWRQDDCGLPLDDKKLARIVGISTRKWGQIKATILEFWTVENGRIYQSRLLKEWRYLLQKSESNREKANKRWRKQDTENIDGEECRSISNGNAPHPHPHIREEDTYVSPSQRACAGASDEAVSDDQPDPEPSPVPAKPKRTAKAKRQVGIDTPLPDDWTPNLGPAAQRIVDGWPPGMIEREEFSFRNHALANGRLAKNWDGAFGTWLAKADERFRQSGNRNQHHRASGYQAADRRDGFTRFIDGELERLGVEGFASEAERPAGRNGSPDGDGSAAPIARLR